MKSISIENLRPGDVFHLSPISNDVRDMNMCLANFAVDPSVVEPFDQEYFSSVDRSITFICLIDKDNVLTKGNMYTWQFLNDETVILLFRSNLNSRC